MSEFVDINNLGLAEEPLGEEFDATSNAFSGPPLLSKGTYTVSAQMREADPSKQFEKREYKGKSGIYYSTRLLLTITQPEDVAGRKIFDDFCASGIFGDRDTSTIASLLHLLGRSDEVAAADSHEALCRSFALALQSNPTVRVRVDWEGRVKREDGTYETIYKTMTDFRQRDDGSYDPEIKDAEGKVIGKARLRVKGYFAAPSGAAA